MKIKKYWERKKKGIYKIFCGWYGLRMKRFCTESSISFWHELYFFLGNVCNLHRKYSVLWIINSYNFIMYMYMCVNYELLNTIGVVAYNALSNIVHNLIKLIETVKCIIVSFVQIKGRGEFRNWLMEKKKESLLISWLPLILL